jgi:hypothetical protein
MVEFVALEHFDGNRTSIAIAQQAVDDLQTAAVFIARIAAHCDRARLALEVRRR